MGNCTAPEHPSFDIMTTSGPLFANVGVNELFPTGGHEAAMPLRTDSLSRLVDVNRARVTSENGRSREEVKLVGAWSCGRIGKRIRGSGMLTVLYAKVELFHHIIIIYFFILGLSAVTRAAGREMCGMRCGTSRGPRGCSAAYLSRRAVSSIYDRGWGRDGQSTTHFGIHNLVRSPLNPAYHPS